jgi:iron complex transport system ATP-binding protein
MRRMTITETSSPLSESRLVQPAGNLVLQFTRVSVWLPDGMTILREIDWQVRPGEQWALLGPNGSGKTTLLSLAGAIRHPSAGSVSVLGRTLGQTSLWDLRERIGQVDSAQKVLDWLPVQEVVLTGLTNTVWPLPDRIDDAARTRAFGLLDLVGCGNLIDREIGTCSQGERQRVRIARAIMPDPPLLLLDEPATGLDLPAREALLAAMSALSLSHPALSSVFVSHHLEELPASTSHALLLKDGQISASGPVEETLTSETVSHCFGFPVEVHGNDGRWSARASANWHTRRGDAPHDTIEL